MNQKYRLGIDLGTSSVGIAAYSLKDNAEIQDLIYLDSYIFGEPVVAKELVTTNTARRNARLIRRQIQRKAARLRKLGYIAKSMGVSQEEMNKIPAEHIHFLRAKAISEKIELPALVKVFFHLVKNRGYSGDANFAEQEIGDEKSNAKKVKKGVVASKIEQTENALKENSFKTLGCLLYHKKESTEKGQPWKKLNEGGTFIYREDIQKEFNLIWQEQAKHHPILSTKFQVRLPDMFPDHKGKTELSLQEAFYSAIFYQRPIRWDVESVGSCSLEPQYKRACTSQLAYQRYRLADNINNLRIKNSQTHQVRALSLQEKQHVFKFIENSPSQYVGRGVIPYQAIYDLLGLTQDERFTKDRFSAAARASKDNAPGLPGNSTLATLYHLGVLADWNILSPKAQELVLEFLANITKFSDVQEAGDESVAQLFSDITPNVANSTPKAVGEALGFIHLLKTKKSFYDKNFSFEQSRASYSVPVLEKLTQKLLTTAHPAEVTGEVVLADIIKELYPTQAASLRGALRPLEEIKTNHPVVDHALAEFKRTIEFVIKKMGQLPTEITVELSREMKNSLSRRQYLENQNKIQEGKRTAAIKELKESHIPVTNTNIDRYLLWEEQEGTCPYCGQPVSITAASQIDHIVPRERGGANEYSNKVLAHSSCNADKNGRLPYECDFAREAIDAYLATKEENKKRNKGEKAAYDTNAPISRFLQKLWTLYAKETKGHYNARTHKRTPTQYGRMLLQKINNLTAKPDEIENDFGNIHSAATAYYTTVVLDWCKDICPKVVPGFGPLTAYLRQSWHFEDVLPLIRLQEGKALYGRDDKSIDPQEWFELFVKQGVADLSQYATSADWQKLYVRPVREFDFKKADVLKEDFENYLSILEDKPNNDTDTQEIFEHYLRDKRGVLAFNKRCDHRHHAVDAAVIGLCTQSQVQRANEHNTRYGGLTEIRTPDGCVKVPGFSVGNAPFYAQVRQQTRRYLTHYTVWHKPDHYPSGAFFDQTAYNICEKEGMKRLTTRQPLEKFIGKITSPKELIEKIELVVVGDMLKKELLSQLETHLSNGLSIEAALLGKEGRGGIIFRGNKLKNIKVMYKTSSLIEFDEEIDKALVSPTMEGKTRNKYYQSGGYACMVFDKGTGKRTDIVPLWKYHQEYVGKELPKDKIYVFAGDILFDKKTQDFYKVKSFKKSAGMVCQRTTDIFDNEKKFSRLSGMLVIKDRKHLAQVKKEYGQ